MLKILHVNRPEKNWVGGDFIKLKKVSEELNKLGVKSDIMELDSMGMDEWHTFSEYDIVHTWNFSMPWSKYALYGAWKQGRKLVSSMIYHDTDAFVSYEFQAALMEKMDACIYETETEIERVERHLTPRNSYIVPNGVDSWWFEPTQEKVPLKDYVLTVGRLEPNKGQLEAALACKELGLTYVCIGEAAVAEYAQQVAEAGAVIYPKLSQDKLKPWYKNCSVYIQPSSTETWGMAVDEAGTQGATLVVSTGFERKNITNALYCIHGNKESITHSLRKAVSKKRSNRYQLQLKERTWEDYAKDILKIYKEII